MRPGGSRVRGAPAPDALEGEVVERRYAGRAAYFLVATEAPARSKCSRRRRRGEGDRVLVAPAPGGPVPRAFPRQGAA